MGQCAVSKEGTGPKSSLFPYSSGLILERTEQSEYVCIGEVKRATAYLQIFFMLPLLFNIDVQCNTQTHAQCAHTYTHACTHKKQTGIKTTVLQESSCQQHTTASSTIPS